MKTIVLTGGGTAGHIVANIALLPTLRKHFEQIVYIGSGAEIEQNLLKPYQDVKYFCIPTIKLVRGFSFKNFKIPFVLLKAKKAATKLLNDLNPDVIFCKGGYVGLPVVLAGAKLHIPIVAHESDLTLGLAHKIVKNKYTFICTTFKTTAQKLKNGIFTGSPVRLETLNGNALKIKNNLKLNSLPVLLVLGGSQGAKQINELIENNLNYLTKIFQVIHIRGKNKLNNHIKHKNYYQMEFCNNMGDLYAAANLCITRGGSNTLHELAYNHIPMLIIPLQQGTRGDQVDNAKYFEQNGFAISLCDKAIDNKKFLNALEELLRKAEQIKNKNLNNEQTIKTITKIIVNAANKKTK